MSNIINYLSYDEYNEFKYYIEINGQKVIVFSDHDIPYKLIPEASYPVEFYLFCDDDPIEIMNNPKYGIEKDNSDYYAYNLYGKLIDGKLDLNGFLMEDDLFSDCENLNGKFVKVNIIRISMVFINNKNV
ncbi:MAG: hypothetical protein ACR2HS_01840 [Gammaproteobacteria bacterium]